MPRPDWSGRVARRTRPFPNAPSAVPAAALIAALAIPFLLAIVAADAFSAPAKPDWEWPKQAKNLKVLPRDTPPEKLRAVMTGFTRSLGVRCQHCHVGEEGKPLSTFDFESDDNPKKGIARDMYGMLGGINDGLKKMKLTGARRVNMWCHTCHHGLPRPATLVEELTAAYDSTGIDSTIAAYRSLRDRFYNRGAYDFGEGALVELGETLARRERRDDAIRIMQMNVELFPESARARRALEELKGAAK